MTLHRLPDLIAAGRHQDGSGGRDRAAHRPVVRTVHARRAAGAERIFGLPEDRRERARRTARNADRQHRLQRHFAPRLRALQGRAGPHAGPAIQAGQCRTALARGSRAAGGRAHERRPGTAGTGRSPRPARRATALAPGTGQAHARRSAGRAGTGGGQRAARGRRRAAPAPGHARRGAGGAAPDAGSAAPGGRAPAGPFGHRDDAGPAGRGARSTRVPAWPTPMRPPRSWMPPKQHCAPPRRNWTRPRRSMPRWRHWRPITCRRNRRSTPRARRRAWHASSTRPSPLHWHARSRPAMALPPGWRPNRGWTRWPAPGAQWERLLRQGEDTLATLAANQPAAEALQTQALGAAEREAQATGALATGTARLDALETTRRAAMAALAGVDADAIGIERQQLDVRRERLAQAERTWTDLAAAHATLAGLARDADRVETARSSAEQGLAEARASAPALEAAMTQAERSLAAAELACAADVEQLRANLEDDAPCPVCGCARAPVCPSGSATEEHAGQPARRGRRLPPARARQQRAAGAACGGGRRGARASGGADARARHAGRTRHQPRAGLARRPAGCRRTAGR